MSYKESANTLRNTPDENGHFGIFGGQYVAETLMPLIIEVCDAWRASKNDPSFWSELEYYRKHYIGRPALFTSPADLLNILMGPSFILKEMSSITLALIR